MEDQETLSDGSSSFSILVTPKVIISILGMFGCHPHSKLPGRGEPSPLVNMYKGKLSLISPLWIEYQYYAITCLLHNNLKSD